MLHEILLSLSGHPSPLLRSAPTSSESYSHAGITPPERELLAQIAHLSELHVKLMTSTGDVASQHPSAVCRAVATAIDSIHLHVFQRKVLEVERGILNNDTEYVGAYNIVPLTAVVAEFTPWTRRIEWLWELVKFITSKGSDGSTCHAAKIMNHLRSEIQSGHRDIEETALSLVTAAESAWLKQVSAWILYGRLPSFGGSDFFVQKARVAGGDEFHSVPRFLPSFVSPKAALSMLFIGRSLNHVRVKSSIDSELRGLDHLSSKLRELSSLSFPLDSATFSRTITSIRLSLSENTLQKILPLSKVIEMLQLLREFFLLRRGEFAMALTHEADDKLRERWKATENLAHEQGGVSLRGITVKEGEVAAVLSRTWAFLASMQGQHADEDEQLELARDLLRLHLVKSETPSPLAPGPGLRVKVIKTLNSSPFRTLLFTVPAALSMQLPSPLDMVFSPADLYLYSCINSYLLSMRRAHIRLTNLWKISSLRRHHPAPSGADEMTVELRERWSARTTSMRSSWTTASAAIFLLAETEAFLQTDIVEALWVHFHAWLTSSSDNTNSTTSSPGKDSENRHDGADGGDELGEESDGEDDIWLQDSQSPSRPRNQREQRDTNPTPKSHPPHDPQSLATAHALYLRTLAHRILLTEVTFTEALYSLLVHVDHLVAHTHRLHSIFVALDLESDAGVVDAFVDLHSEEAEVTALLRGVERKVQRGIGGVVSALRSLENDPEFIAAWEGDDTSRDEAASDEHDMSFGDDTLGYRPPRLGSITRLLMKLDFGTWLGPQSD
ncbi:unnamed protein product [Clonostachys rhizophaga]|uniref:Spindle pole body component n=1 Tax=Clonostachys rhizophaga TaxID=160324 RepID=A0A9N9VUP9_9HYPO|nr:unnamed protein product [Clonostachys rhizophaga]